MAASYQRSGDASTLPNKGAMLTYVEAVPSAACALYARYLLRRAWVTRFRSRKS